MIFTQNYIVEEILNFCKYSSFQDVTIICQNGSFQSNSFLLAAMFPIFRDILNTSVQYEESYVISMPDMDKNCLETFCANLYQKSSKIIPNSAIQQLMRIFPSVKGEVKEDEPDYSLLDSESDSEVYNKLYAFSEVNHIENDDIAAENMENSSLFGADLKTEKEDDEDKFKKDSADDEQSINFKYDPETDMFNCPDCEYSTRKTCNAKRHYETKHIILEQDRKVYRCGNLRP